MHLEIQDRSEFQYKILKKLKEERGMKYEKVKAHIQGKYPERIVINGFKTEKKCNGVVLLIKRRTIK